MTAHYHLFDETTKQCLENLFGGLYNITKRISHEHLNGDKYDNADEIS